MWWKCLLGCWSGRSFFISQPFSQQEFTDISGSWGCGAFAKDVGWFQLAWPQQWQKVDIAVKELVLVTIAAAIWGAHWAGKRICFQSDSMVVVSVLNQWAARSPPLMHMLCCISLLSVFLVLSLKQYTYWVFKWCGRCFVTK